MAFIRIALVSTLVLAALGEPLRYRRSPQNNALIFTTGDAAAAGSGVANDQHAATVVAIGIPASPGSGWNAATPGVPATIVFSNTGLSEVGNDAAILEVTSNDGAGNLAALENVNVEQYSDAIDTLDVAASGGDAALASSSDAHAEGSGTSAGTGTLVIEVNTADLGLSHQ